MKKQSTQSVTSLPPSPDEERHGRMLKYSIAMAIRMVCVILAFIFPEWWRWLFVVAAVILPYIAVVIANTASPTSSATVARPGGLVQAPGQGDHE
jgi:predicted tellurium resistance membrane protein TerC